MLEHSRTVSLDTLGTIKITIYRCIVTGSGEPGQFDAGKMNSGPNSRENQEGRVPYDSVRVMHNFGRFLQYNGSLRRLGEEIEGEDAHSTCVTTDRVDPLDTPYTQFVWRYRSKGE